HVPTLVRSQTRLPVDLLPLARVRAGADAVAETIRTLAEQGVRILCADAETDEDIRALGQGMARSGVTCVAADPGPLTAAFVAASAPPVRGRVLVVAGSVTDLTRRQMNHLEAEMGARLITVDARSLGAGGAAAEAEVRRVVDELAAIPAQQPVIGVR